MLQLENPPKMRENGYGENREINIAPVTQQMCVARDGVQPFRRPLQSDNIMHKIIMYGKQCTRCEFAANSST